MVVADNFALFVTWILIVVGLLSLAFSAPTVERERLPQGEYYALMLFAIAGMMLMADGDRPARDLPCAGSAVARRLRAHRDPARFPARDRSRVQVLPAGRVFERVFSLRDRVHLRRDRQHAPRSDRPPDGAGRRPDADAVAGVRAAARRFRLQGVRRAVPHVDAGCLRRGAAGRDRLHVHGREGRGVRRVRSRVSRRVRAAASRVERGHLGRRGGDDDRGNRGRRRAVERQADAGVLEHRARRLPARGAGLGERRRQGRGALLPAGVRRDEPRRIRRHRDAGHGRSARTIRSATTRASGTSIPRSRR